MPKVGRPKKKGAKKAGDLKDGLCRFSFIAAKSEIDTIKQMAAMEGVSIKLFMSRLLKTSINSNPYLDRFLQINITYKGFNKKKIFKYQDIEKQLTWIKGQKKLFEVNKKKSKNPNYIDWGNFIYSSKEVLNSTQ